MTVNSSVLHDPLSFGVPLPLKARYYPMGVPVEIVTNSSEVLAVTDRMWAQYPPVEHGGLVTFRVAVANRNAAVPPQPVAPLGQGHLTTIIQGPDNFAVCDLSTSYGFAWLTQDVAANASYLRYYFLEPAVYLMVNAGFLAPVHGSCVAIGGKAALLCGDSGAGKTSIAYSCAKRGWTYLADDATHLVRGRTVPTVAGRPFSIRFRETSRQLFPELGVHVPERRPNGKLDIEVDTAELGLSVALESPLACFVFLDRQPAESSVRIRPVAADDAFQYLSTPFCYGDEKTRSEQADTLRTFLKLPVVRLTYSNLDSAETALRELL